MHRVLSHIGHILCTAEKQKLTLVGELDRFSVKLSHKYLVQKGSNYEKFYTVLITQLHTYRPYLMYIKGTASMVNSRTLVSQVDRYSVKLSLQIVDIRCQKDESNYEDSNEDRCSLVRL